MLCPYQEHDALNLSSSYRKIAMTEVFHLADTTFGQVDLVVRHLNPVERPQT